MRSNASSLDDIAFLARSEHRVTVLEALAAASRHRDDLRAATGASSPTMGRVLRDLEDRGWLTNDGQTWALTRAGRYVADSFAALSDAMATERTLRDVWELLPSEMDGFSPDLFTDAVVSFPGPGYPYQPVERLTELIERSDSMRGFGSTVVKSSNLEAACRAIQNGMTFEYVYSPENVETLYAWNPEEIARTVACDNCTTYVHDAIPDGDSCGVDIFDDRVTICCHDVESNVLRAVVDTDAPAARDWADSLFERIRRDAAPLDAPDREGRSPD